jgi:two-component system, OmpR family, KDP operon response regulator KdpE
MAEQILIIDDEPAIAQTLKPLLIAQHYDVTVVGTAAEALRKARQTAYDIALLDLGLPDADGKEIIANLRALSCRSVLVISARHQEAEKIAALDGGADDYLNKPFSIDELLARIRAALRRSNNSTPSQAFRSRELQIDFSSRIVRFMGEDVRLSPKEFALLEALCKHAGQVVTRRQLLLAGWNDPAADGQNLRTYITLLRQKLEVDPGEPKLIVTETGVGYRLMATMEN